MISTSNPIYSFDSTLQILYVYPSNMGISASIKITMPKPYYGKSHEDLLACLGYVRPDLVDNLYTLDDVAKSEMGGWDVILKQDMKFQSLDTYTLIELKKELKRRGLTYTLGDKRDAVIEIIEDDIELNEGEEVIDWTDRPPIFNTLPAGHLSYLIKELTAEIQLKRKEWKKLSLAHGWKKMKHNDGCLHGDNCTSLGIRTDFECFFCLEVECGSCCGLSPRQTTYTNRFICHACRVVAEDGCVKLTLSDIGVQ